jgi:peptidyl-prolyl cis-trans isomerase D
LIDATLDASDLAPAAKDLHLDVQKTPLFTRTGGPGIAANPAVLKAAFSNDVLVDGRVSGAIELGPNHIVVVRVDQHEKPAPKPLDQVRDEIRKKLIAQDAAKASRERTETLYARLQKGETLDAIADAKVKTLEQKGIGRYAANLDHQLVEAVFNLDRPQAGKSVVGRVGLPDDAYALISLDAVTDGDPAKLDPKTKEAALNALRQSMGIEVTRGFVDSLRKAAEIKIAEKQSFRLPPGGAATRRSRPSARPDRVLRTSARPQAEWELCSLESYALARGLSETFAFKTFSATDRRRTAPSHRHCREHA